MTKGQPDRPRCLGALDLLSGHLVGFQARDHWRARRQQDHDRGAVRPGRPGRDLQVVSLKFGLAAYAFTTSTQTATAIGDALESGMVAVNNVVISTPETPFGGIKDSGYGHEGGIEGLEAYTAKKFISQA